MDYFLKGAILLIFSQASKSVAIRGIQTIATHGCLAHCCRARTGGDAKTFNPYTNFFCRNARSVR